MVTNIPECNMGKRRSSRNSFSVYGGIKRGLSEQRGMDSKLGDIFNLWRVKMKGIIDQDSELFIKNMYEYVSENWGDFIESMEEMGWSKGELEETSKKIEKLLELA